jgi:hypothetical protein
MMLSDETLELGGRAAAALLGVDALYRREREDREGLVVLNMANPGEAEAETFPSYHEARRAFETLEAEAARLPEADRRTYYRRLCQSTLAFIRWREEGLPFNVQLEGFLHVPVAPASREEMGRIRSRLLTLLTELGYGGDLRAQCAAWEEGNRVPPDEVEGALNALLDEAWVRTEERVMDIPAPRSDGMRVSAVSGTAFNARCDYRNRTIEVNTDPTLTRPGLKHLAVHEGYPGHFLQFRVRETAFRDGRAPADNLLSVVNSASSSVFEGIADAGMEMLDWLSDPNDQVQALLNRHRAGIGTEAAWRLHALRWPEEEVTDWLRGHTLVGGEGWVENRMAFLSAPARAVLIWSYWWGEPVVARAWRQVTGEERPGFLRYLYGRMHSNETVEMFHLSGHRHDPGERVG